MIPRCCTLLRLSIGRCDQQEPYQPASSDMGGGLSKQQVVHTGLGASELIAPKSVIFFSQEEEPLGNKKTLRLEIHVRARTAIKCEEAKRLLRRIDWHLMSLVSIMFLLENIDYANASNARIVNGGTPQNILKQLQMSSDDFNWASTIYNLPYIIAEAPSDLFIRPFPSRWESRIVVSWGLVLACHAAVSNKSGLYAARFFLGMLWRPPLLHTA